MSLNPRELEVLEILHASEEPLTSTQIVKASEDLTQSTVQAVVRKLMANNLVEIKGVTHSGNVLSRTFGVSDDSKATLTQMFLDTYKSYKSIINLRKVVEGMLDMEQSEEEREECIQVIERILSEAKSEVDGQ